MKTENDKRIDSLEFKIDNLTNKIGELSSMFCKHINMESPKEYAPLKSVPKNESLVSKRESTLDDDIKAKIADIMRKFDFNKVHDVMSHLDWKWISPSGLHVPSVDEIRKEAKRILVDSAYEEVTIATGGLRANYSKNGAEDDTDFISLEFIVADWEGYANDDDDEDDESIED